jgi:hypothetical protein
MREIAIGGRDVQIGGLSGADDQVRVTSGRMPGACTEERCEVLQIGPADAELVHDDTLPVVVVGTGTLTDQVPFGGAFTPTGDGEGPPPVFLVSTDLDGLDALPALRSQFRTYGWIAPIAPGAIHSWDIEDLLAAEAEAKTSLQRANAAFTLEAPDAALRDVRTDSRVAERRILVVGGVGAALLLGFALLAASTVRRDVHAEWRRLDVRGARRWHLWLFAAAELGWIALAGLVVGVVAAVAAVAVAADLAGLGAWEIVARSLLATDGLLALALAWVVATVVLVAAQRTSLPSRGRIGTLDVVAVAALGALVLAAERGTAGTGGLDQGTDPLLPLVPVLASLVVGIVAYRIVGPLARLGERATRGASTARLALVAIARRPEPAAATVAFLAVSIGLAVFAESYRATLERGQHDQAAFAEPLDATVTAGRALVPPLDAASIEQYASVQPGAVALPVLRRNATVPSVGTLPLRVEVLGVPASGLGDLRWRSDYADRSPEALAAALAPGDFAGLATTPVPDGTTRLRLPVSLDGVSVVLQLYGQSAGGQPVRMDLGVVKNGQQTVEIDAPPQLAGGSIVGLDVAQTATASGIEAHQDAEGGTGVGSASGQITLGPLQAGTGADGPWTPVTDWNGFTGIDGLRPSGEPQADGVPFSYILSSGGHGVVRLPQPTDDTAIPVAVGPGVAAAAGPSRTVALGFGGYRVNGVIVASLARFPTGGDRPVVLADLDRLRTAIEAAAPGQGRPGEVWVGAPDPAALQRSLAAPPYALLDVTTYAAAEKALVDDPLARGILIVLACTSALSLLLAGAGLVVGVLGDVRDGRGELYDLEALGLRPTSLRRRLSVRAALLAALAIPLGFALGAVLASFVVDLVRVSANAGTPEPPLLTELGAARLAAILAVVLVLGAVAVWAVARATFREPAPVRPAGVDG